MAAANKRIIIVNEDDDVKVTPETKGLLGVIPVEVVDGSGDQITAFGSGGLTTPTIYNKAMPVKNTEYSQALPNGTKKLLIKGRSIKGHLKFCFTSGASGTTYYTLSYGSALTLDGLNLTSKTLYFQSTIDNQTCQIMCWT